MNVLELFAGSRSVGKCAAMKGWNVFSSDIVQFGGIDYVVDILEFNISRIPFKYIDVLWASPPCTGFSVAALGKNWNKNNGIFHPKSESAVHGMLLMKKTLELINELQPKYWYIENPRSVLRKLPMMHKIGIQHTVTYCQYGDIRMKPTDIWTNNDIWIPKSPCKNGDTCHVAAPRGSRTGTQGIRGAFDRSKIPENLCSEILNASKTIERS